MKIKEILETGQLQSAEKAKAAYNIDALDAFQKIYGIGPAKAATLIEAGITGIEQLRIALKENPKLLNDKQKIGLLYYEDLLERIPREEMDHHSALLHSYALRNKISEIDIVGSYRRATVSSGDIDVLIRTSDSKQLHSMVEMLIAAKYIEQVLALGLHKCMAICRLPGQKARRLDLLVTPDHEYAYALLYFTGSDRFNVAFRQHALEKGYTLNEARLLKVVEDKKEVPAMKTEKDIFAFLGLRYIEPSHRVDGSQIIRIRKRPVVAAKE